MNEWNFDQRLQKLEQKALFRKINLDAVKKAVPPLLLYIGSVGLIFELGDVGQKVAAGFLAVGSFLLIFTGLMDD